MHQIVKRSNHYTQYFPCSPIILPLEVCWQVLEMLSPDVYVEPQRAEIEALRNCSLVCKAWRTLSQMRLFHSVLLGDLHSLRSLARPLIDPDLYRDHLPSRILCSAVCGSYSQSSSSSLSARSRNISAKREIFTYNTAFTRVSPPPAGC